MAKYRVRFSSGRTLGPIDEEQLLQIKNEGLLKKNSLIQEFPTGDWISFEEFSKNFSLFKVSDNQNKDETFILDFSKLKLEKESTNEQSLKESDKFTNKIDDSFMGETVILPEKKMVDDSSFKTSKISNHKEDSYLDDEKTRINPDAQREIQRMREEQRRAKENQSKSHEEEGQTNIFETKDHHQVVAMNESGSKDVNLSDDKTQLIQISPMTLLSEANEFDQQREMIVVEGSQKEDNKTDAKNKKEAEPSKALFKNKKFLYSFIVLLVISFLFPMEEKKDSISFKVLKPKIEVPVPFDVANQEKSIKNFKKGLNYFMKGNFRDYIFAGEYFHKSYINDIKNIDAFSYMIRSYAHQLQYSEDFFKDAKLIFEIIKLKKASLLQNVNGVIGLSHFYRVIEKYDSAQYTIQKYLKLHPQKVTEDLFAHHVLTFVKSGKLDKAGPFIKALKKNKKKNLLSYIALIEFFKINENQKELDHFLAESLKKYPENVKLLLSQSENYWNNKEYKKSKKYLNKAYKLGLDFNSINLAKFYEISGLLLSLKKPEEAASLLKKSLDLVNSDRLRYKLSLLSKSGGKFKETDKIITESLAVKNLNQAKEFFKTRSYELALSSAVRAVDIYPKNIEAQIFLSKVQAKLGLPDLSVKTLENLATENPQNTKLLVAYIESLINSYQYKKAQERLLIARSSMSEVSWEIASLFGRLYFEMGDYSKSIYWLSYAVKLNPLNDADFFLLSKIYLKFSKFKNAKKYLNSAIELHPLNPDYRVSFARLLYETKDDLAAIGYLLSLQENFGSDPKILSEIAISYYRSGKVKDYLDYKKKLEAEYFTDKSLYEFLIKAALLDDRFQDIPFLVEKLIAIEPSEFDSMMTAAKVLFEDGQLEKSAKWLKRIKQRLPTYPMLQYYLAKIDFLLGKYDDAFDKINADIESNGENDISLVFMAQILEKKKNFVEAEKTYKKAQKINPRSFDAIMGLAEIQYQRGNHEFAVDLFKQALKINNDKAIVYKRIGDAYRQLSQSTLAIESYKLYLEMDPNSKDKRSIQQYISLMQ